MGVMLSRGVVGMSCMQGVGSEVIGVNGFLSLVISWSFLKTVVCVNFSRNSLIQIGNFWVKPFVRIESPKKSGTNKFWASNVCLKIAKFINMLVKIKTRQQRIIIMNFRFINKLLFTRIIGCLTNQGFKLLYILYCTSLYFCLF